MDFKEKEKYGFNDLVEIVKILRSPEGCPWDREQTHKSIRKDFIEETYEVIEAIDTDDVELLKEELGDVLFSAVNVSRFIKTDAEEALTSASDKFLSRFTKVEELAAERGIDMKAVGIDELDKLWDEAKSK